MSTPAPFALHVLPDRERFIVAPEGDVDLENAAQVQAALLDALGDGWDEVVVDLRRVTFMDSQGVHVLLEALAVARRAGARLTMVDGAPSVSRLFDLLGVRDQFPAARTPVPT